MKILITKNKWHVMLDNLNRLKLVNEDTGVVDYFVIHKRFTSDGLYYYIIAYDNPFLLPKYIKTLLDNKTEFLLSEQNKD
jgi:hypothetical protein